MAQTMTPTEAMLLERFGAPIALLKDVCTQYLGLSPAVASRHAALHRLQVPAFRLTDSQKAPLFVHIKDLARVIDDRYTSAAQEWRQSQI